MRELNIGNTLLDVNGSIQIELEGTISRTTTELQIVNDQKLVSDYIMITHKILSESINPVKSGEKTEKNEVNNKKTDKQ